MKLNHLSYDKLCTLRQHFENLLAQVNQAIQTYQQNNQTADRPQYEFKIQVTLDPRKHGAPYVAHLTWDGKQLKREFYQLQKTYGKKSVTLHGTFKAAEGDILETRTEASWKNDYRYWLLVHNQKLYLVAEYSNSKKKAKVEQYLQGALSAEQLLRGAPEFII